VNQWEDVALKSEEGSQEKADSERDMYYVQNMTEGRIFAHQKRAVSVLFFIFFAI
jgi:hypothetical protein